MPGKSERVKVEVKDSTEGDMRTFNITLTAPASDFVLTDLLKQRGAIGGLDAELKQAVKAATENYLKAAESLIARLATEPKPGVKSRTNGRGNGKSSREERPSSMPESEQHTDSGRDLSASEIMI